MMENVKEKRREDIKEKMRRIVEKEETIKNGTRLVYSQRRKAIKVMILQAA